MLRRGRRAARLQRNRHRPWGSSIRWPRSFCCPWPARQAGEVRGREGCAPCCGCCQSWCPCRACGGRGCRGAPCAALCGECRRVAVRRRRAASQRPVAFNGPAPIFGAMQAEATSLLAAARSVVSEAPAQPPLSDREACVAFAVCRRGLRERMLHIIDRRDALIRRIRALSGA